MEKKDEETEIEWNQNKYSIAIIYHGSFGKLDK